MSTTVEFKFKVGDRIVWQPRNRSWPVEGRVTARTFDDDEVCYWCGDTAIYHDQILY